MIDNVEKMTPEAELQALEDLLASDGWTVLEAHRARAWGADACLEAIDKALAALKSGDPIEEVAITKRIRDTFTGVNAEASWARRRVSELRAAIAAKKATPSIVDRFKGLRRVP